MQKININSLHKDLDSDPRIKQNREMKISRKSSVIINGTNYESNVVSSLNAELGKACSQCFLQTHHITGLES